MKVKSNTLQEAYDLIVIGSDPAGLTVAHKYDELTTDHKVLIVESRHETNIRSVTRKLNIELIRSDPGRMSTLREVSVRGEYDGFG